MKIKDGFVVKKIADSTVVVPVGDNLVNLQLMITLNESGAFLWNCLQSETTEEELVAAMTAEYAVDAETARQDVNAFIMQLKEHKILHEA
ncbi:MAG: PqqD family protein [Ruminococcaceae bacterium]|nr:PqqD family protein [Oscillospiraceae bacterium]